MLKGIFIALILSQFIFASNYIKSAKWSNGKFIIKFENNIKDVKNWNFYHMPSKKYKYIYDIKNVTIKAGHINFKQSKSIDQVAIGQYKKDILRVTLRHNKKLKLDYKISNKSLIFEMIKDKPKKKITTVSQTVKSSVKNRKKKIITIDAGHGGKDGGAVCKDNKSVEKNIVLDIAKYTKDYLMKMGYTVHLTRSTDNFISLGQRTKMANKKGSDLFISIHANSLPKKGKFRKKNGIEVYFLSQARTERAKRVAAKENYRETKQMSKSGKNNYLTSLSHKKIIQSHKLAIDIQNSVINRLTKYYYKVKNGGVKGAPFWVLVGAQMPSILLEVGYITGDVDGKRLLDRLYKKRLAKGVAIGVEEYFKKN